MALQKIRNHTLLLPIYLPAVFVSLSLGVTDPVLPLLALELGADYAMVGVIVSGMTFGMLLTDMPAGLVVGRLGEKRTMLLGAGIASLGGFAMLLASSVFLALLARIVLGVGFSILALARHTYISERVPIAERGRAIAMFGGVARASRLAGPIIGGAVADAFGLAMPFAVIGSLWLCAMLAVWLFMPKTEPLAGMESVSVGEYVGKIGRTLQTHWRILSAAGTAQMLAQLVRRGRNTLIPLFGANMLGLDVVEIGIVMSIAQGIDTAFFYPAGVIMDRFGRKFAIIPSFLLQGIGLLLLPITTSFVTLSLASGLIGLGNGLSSGTMMTLGADLSPDNDRSTFLGTWRMIGSAGFTVSPILVGGVADIFSLSGAALVLGGLGLATSGIFGRFVPETLKKNVGVISAD